MSSPFQDIEILAKYEFSIYTVLVLKKKIDYFSPARNYSAVE
jgi:hypothetical protein